MRRREFITLAGGAVAAWPLIALGKTQRIAIVVPAVPVTVMTETADDPLFPALLKELRRLGYVEGQNLLIERYSGRGRASHYADLARDVVSRNPDVIIALTNESSSTSKRRPQRFRPSEYLASRSKPASSQAWHDQVAISLGSL